MKIKPSLMLVGVLTFAFIIAIGSYALYRNHEAKFFVQGKIRIALPAKMPGNKDGTINESLFSDGGTVKYKIFDANGASFDVYIDHRIGYEKNWGTIYLNNYPDSPHSVRIIDQANFRKKIITPLNLNE